MIVHVDMLTLNNIVRRAVVCGYVILIEPNNDANRIYNTMIDPQKGLVAFTQTNSESYAWQPVTKEHRITIDVYGPQPITYQWKGN